MKEIIYNALTKTETFIERELTPEEVAANLESRKDSLRKQREKECFSIINRGQLWYSQLDVVQLEELEVWYQEWLDVTETLTIPEKPNWLEV